MFDDDEISVVEITYKTRGGVTPGEYCIGAEYHLVLQLDPKSDHSWITYYIAPFKGKSRKLSRFETDQILNKVRNLTPKIPPPTDIEVLVLADPPPPFIELSIKYGDSSIQMNWTNDSYNYDEDEPTHPADQLIDLISEVEPFDYEGLGVEQYRLM